MTPHSSAVVRLLALWIAVTYASMCEKTFHDGGVDVSYDLTPLKKYVRTLEL